MTKSVVGRPGASMNIPSFWRQFLLVVSIGKAAVAGAGLALAALGALDIAFAVVASQWLDSVQSHIAAITVAGGVVGGVVGWALNQLA